MSGIIEKGLHAVEAGSPRSQKSNNIQGLGGYDSGIQEWP